MQKEEYYLLKHGCDVPPQKSHQEGESQTAGHQVEEGRLGSLEDVHDSNGGAQTQDVGNKTCVEVESGLALAVTEGGEVGRRKSDGRGEGGGKRGGGKERDGREGGGGRRGMGGKRVEREGRKGVRREGREGVVET